MRHRQRLVIAHHPESVLPKFGQKVIPRARRPFDMPPSFRIERGSELNPELPFLYQVPPHPRVIAADQHRCTLVAGRVEDDLPRRKDVFDGVPALEDGLVALQ